MYSNYPPVFVVLEYNGIGVIKLVFKWVNPPGRGDLA